MLERGTVKRRDLLLGFAAGVGFTAGNAYLWQLAEKSSREHMTGLADSAEDLLDLDPLVLGEEGIIAPQSALSSDPLLSEYAKELNKTVVKGRVADATDMPDLGDVRLPELTLTPSEAVASSPGKPDDATATQPGAFAGSDVPSLSERDRLLERVRNFDGNFSDDIYLPEAERPALHSLFQRFRRAEKFIGHGNYNLLGFDQLFRFGRNFPEIGRFTDQEMAIVERLFYTEAQKYGFHGKKVTEELTATINPNDTVKIPASGHFLLRGDSEAYYNQIRNDIGDSVILTSGVRGNVKQMHLFVAKCLESHYNLSKSSRSLAPPGHSYHGVGDFDVGRVGWGYSNFTDRFAETDEFKRMQDLGYVRIRYTKDNFYGVRFEPWHIKVS